MCKQEFQFPMSEIPLLRKSRLLPILDLIMILKWKTVFWSKLATIESQLINLKWVFWIPRRLSLKSLKLLSDNPKYLSIPNPKLWPLRLWQLLKMGKKNKSRPLTPNPESAKPNTYQQHLLRSLKALIITMDPLLLNISKLAYNLLLEPALIHSLLFKKL